MGNAEEKQKLQGSRLQEVRRLKYSQSKFAEWLQQIGFTGDYGKPYKVKTIAAWENGRRKIPEKVINAVAENFTFQGEKVQYAYITGDSDFITQNVGGIIHHKFSTFGSKASWTATSKSDIEEIANSPLNKFSILLLDSLLPLYGHSKSDFFDIGRFSRYMYKKFGSLIDDYIEFEAAGK